MPVTAKLSKRFYDQFGEATVSELVDWFNQVDSASHSSLRELNELNFARFDAKLGERLAEMRADIDRRFTESRAYADRRFADLDVRLAETERRLESRLIRWMVGLMMAQTTAVAAIIFAAAGLVIRLR